MSDHADFSIGDFYEGVLLETCRDENRSITRPRVRPLEHFPGSMRVEFPRDLREDHPLNTRFRADVSVAQKHWSSGAEKGPRYLVAKPSSIVREASYVPDPTIMAVRKPGTASGRAHIYELVPIPRAVKTVLQLREQAYLLADMAPPATRREDWQRTRSAIIAQYALCRSRGRCEACTRPAPFMRRNGEPYLEVHHITGLAESGPDHPLNVAAVCPNCHSRVTHGRDAEEYNSVILSNVKAAEARLESQAC
jgi:hypothetical protein